MFVWRNSSTANFIQIGLFNIQNPSYIDNTASYGYVAGKSIDTGSSYGDVYITKIWAE